MKYYMPCLVTSSLLSVAEFSNDRREILQKLLAFNQYIVEEMNQIIFHVSLAAKKEQ
jgi:hypothetical protein